MTLLEVQGLNKKFGGLHAVNDVSFKVSAGTIKSVIGPNGAGKTTLFNLLSGFIVPDSGRILFLDRDVAGHKPHLVARRGMSRTFQHIQLFPHMTVLENLLMGRHRHTTSGFLAGMLNLPGGRRETKAAVLACREILDLLGIGSLGDKEATSLAYGQQRVVEIGRALACEPALLLLDEPAAGLNMRETEEMSGLITSIRERGVTVLIVEHDMSLVMEISDEILVLSYGSTIAEDVPAAVQKNPEVIRIYLGEDGDA